MYAQYTTRHANRQACVSADPKLTTKEDDDGLIGE
jgi:hypothetical protein